MEGGESALLRTLVDKLPAMIAYWDTRERCRFANRAYEIWFGVRPEALIGKEMKELLGPLYPLNRPYIQGALRGEEQQFEREIPDPAGGPPRYSQAHYIPDIVDGAVRGFCVLVVDITRRKRAEESLRRLEWQLEWAQQDAAAQRRRDEDAERLRLVLEGAPTGMVLVDSRGRIALVNTHIEQLFGYGREELVGQPIERLMPDRFQDRHREHLAEFVDAPKARAMGAGRDLYGRRKDGSEVPVEVGLSPLSTPDGEFVLSSVVDVSARRRAEIERADLYDQIQCMNTELEERVHARTAALTQTLREREVLLQEKTSLLREVHHRVKNNLQLISSLLNLQADQIEDERERLSFRDAQGRIRSIALLHESLYQSGDLGRVDMREYVDTLVAMLRRTHGGDVARVDFVIEVDRVLLPVDLAVPCGLLVNELVTNALKHAFRGVRHAARDEVRIEMRREADRLTITVADNGVGFAGGIDPHPGESDERHASIGLALVRDLSTQLGGRASFETLRGARCSVTFPVDR